MNARSKARAGGTRGRGAIASPGVREVHVVLPGDIDDPARPSGGNGYDRRVCEGLDAAGWSVREVAVPGTWPRPARAACARLAEALDGIPSGATVLLDGLVACAIPEVVVPHAGRLRLVVLVHLPLADETGLAPSDAAALDAAERRTLRAAAAIVTTSAALGHRLVTHHRLPPDLIHVAAPGVDGAPLAAGTPGGGRLLCVASVTPRKGHDVLIEALAGLAHLAWTCVCAGPLDRDRRFTGLVRRQVGAWGLQDRVTLVGPRAGTDLAELYAQSDLLVLPSRAETYGMVITEALACGLPVLSTAVGGIPEALGRAPGGELPGLLVRSDDPASLAAALRDWLEEPALRDRLRSAARARRVNLRGWEETTTTLTDVLHRVGLERAGLQRIEHGSGAPDE